MADVKCARCDRYYSKFRSRCPYCGTLKSTKGKRVTEGGSQKWKVITGIVILLLLIAAVLAILYITYFPSETGGEQQQGEKIDAGGVSTEGSGEDIPDPAKLKNLKITYLGEPINDITMKVYENLQLGFKTDPEDYEGEVSWTTSDGEVLSVMQSGEITALKAGNAYLTITVDGRTSECYVRIKER